MKRPVLPKPYSGILHKGFEVFANGFEVPFGVDIRQLKVDMTMFRLGMLLLPAVIHRRDNPCLSLTLFGAGGEWLGVVLG